MRCLTMRMVVNLSFTGTWKQGGIQARIESEPSNKVSKLNMDVRLFRANGAREFRVVDRETRTIRVRRQDHTSREYEPGDTIPLCFGEGSVAVADVFQGL